VAIKYIDLLHDVTNMSESKKDPIENIVIAGGGSTGLIAHGILQALEKRGAYSINNIKRIYGTSVGALLAVLLALKYEWEVLDKYLIERPWHKVFQINVSTFFAAYQKRGLLGIEVFHEILTSLFLGKDLEPQITLKELYEYSGIEIHMYTVNVNTFTLCDLSHLTHPDWAVIDAVYASCAIPTVFAPLVKEGVYYCDGGLIMNYPIGPCIDAGIPLDRILGIPNQVEPDDNAAIDDDSTLFEYIMCIMQHSFHRVISSQGSTQVPNEYAVPCKEITIDDLMVVIQSAEHRAKRIELGRSIIDRTVDESIQGESHELVQGSGCDLGIKVDDGAALDHL